MITTVTFNVCTGIVPLLTDTSSDGSDIADYVSEWKEWATDDFTDADGSEWKYTGHSSISEGVHDAVCDVTYVPTKCRKYNLRFEIIEK